MDTTIPFLRSQTELLADIEAQMRDTNNERWSEAEIYRAINQALLTWKDKVTNPFVFTITGGWLGSDYDYVLPNYVRPPLYPQLKRLVPYNEYDILDSSTSTWQNLVGWELESDGAGGLAIRWSGPPRTLDGRVLFYAPNSRVPLTLPVTSGSTAADATTVVLSTVVDVDDVGFVKIEGEYKAYAGLTRGTSTTTLLNIVPALYGTSAAVHDSGSTVTWCVGVDNMGLYYLLYRQVKALLNEYKLVHGGVQETSRYEKMMGYHQGMADTWFATYKPSRPSPKLVLNRKAVLLR